MPDVLSTRALNRTTLHRQGLLTRGGEVVPTIEHLVGLQSQNPLDPYYALAARLNDFTPDQLAPLLEDRHLVRATLMRGTLHLVTTRDYRKLRPVFADVLERLFNSTSWAKDIAGLSRKDILTEAERLFEEEPMTRAALGRKLASKWPDAPGASLAQAATHLLPLVQPTPRGVWGQKKAAVWATSRSWLGDQAWNAESVDEIVLRYLGAFGPASVSDIRVWSGLTGLRTVIDRLRPQLRVWMSETGTELFDVLDAVYPDPHTPAPVRFLPEYDNVLIGYADRSRFFPEGMASEGWVGNLLVDGFYAGSWSLEETKGDRRLEVKPQDRMSKDNAREVEKAGYRLLPSLWNDGLRASVHLELGP